MGWIANVLLVIGVLILARKDRRAFLFTVAGEALWVYVCWERDSGADMIAICVLFFFLALRNYVLWGNDSK